MLLRRRHIVRFLLAVPIVWLVSILIIAVLDQQNQPIPPLIKPVIIDDEITQETEKIAINSNPVVSIETTSIVPTTIITKRVVKWRPAGEETPPLPSPLAPDAPGEQAQGVNIDKDKLDPEERRKFDEGFRRNSFNQYASDMISLHRSLPDVRDKECASREYPNDDLPDTSVIVCFHNEAWSTLLRTVHSIIDRSPPRLLTEIVLVDDFSDMDHLKQPLDDYLKNLPIVKLVRTTKREGLIRARLLGTENAKGTVLTYLDSHCECSKGWLEPMLYRIYQNWTNVVTPMIDVIDDNTLEYHHGTARHTSVGGFDWNLQFSWHVIPEREHKRRASFVDPVQSPTMAGGLFAIHSKYFDLLGRYDSGMDIWGGENLELSFKVWMCGGSLEIVLCSRVGHIFRKKSPYAWKTGENVVKKNSVRMAEVWMDGYRFYYYERFNYDLGNFGDVSDRKAIREGLQCKPFEWFMKNIYPEQFIPGEALASGEIKNKAKSMCLDSAVDHVSNKPVNMWPCHNQGGNQYWMLSKDGEIRRDRGCFDYVGRGSANSTLNIFACHGAKGNQNFEYLENNLIRHKNHDACVEMSQDGKQVLMRPCDPSNINQQWIWRRRSPGDLPLHLQTDLPIKIKNNAQ